MNETNIGTGSSRNPVGGMNTSFEIPVSKGIPAAFYSSVIEQSDQAAISSQFNASVPTLEVPNNALINLQMGMNEISVQVLKSWSDSIETEAEIIKEWLNSPGYLARQEEIRKIASGANKVPVDDHKDTTSSTTRKIPEIKDTTPVDITDRYSWLLFMGAIVASALMMSAPRYDKSSQGQSGEGIGVAAGVAPAVGGMGLQNSQGVVDAAGNVTGVREVNVKSTDPLANPLNQVANTGSNVDEIESGSQSTGAAQFLGQAFLIGVSEVALFQSGVSVASLAAVHGMHAEAIVIQTLWDEMTPKPADQASLVAGWLSSLWGIGLLYQASAEKVMTYGGDSSKDKQAMTMDVAKTYAQKVLDNVNSPQFILSFQTALAKAGQEQPSNTDDVIARAKIMLLSLALGLLAKLEVGSHKDEGWINEIDFAGLLNGSTDIGRNDLFETAGLKSKLIAQINDLLNGLDPTESAKVKYSLLSFMSTNPSLEDLFDQQKGFEKILNQPSFEQGVFGKTPV